MLCVDSLASQEQLGKVLGFPVCDCPAVLLYLEPRLLLVLLLGVDRYGLSLLLALDGRRLDLDWLWVRKLLVGHLVLLHVLLLVLELQANNAHDLTHTLLHLKQLIHIPQLQLIIIKDELP